MFAARRAGAWKAPPYILDRWTLQTRLKNGVGTRRTWGIWCITFHLFFKWMYRLPMKVRDMVRTRYNAWIISAPFCATRFIKDVWYFPRDGTMKTGECISRGRITRSYSKICLYHLLQGFSRKRALSVWGLLNIFMSSYCSYVIIIPTNVT